MGFHGYVVSDCGAVMDIYRNHHYQPTLAQTSAISLERAWTTSASMADSRSPMIATTTPTWMR